MVAGEGKKRAKFWAVRRKVVQGSPTSNNHNHNHNNAKPRTSGAPKFRPPLPRFRVWVFGGWVQQQHQKIWPKHSNIEIGQSRLAKVGQHSETLKLAKVGLSKVGQNQELRTSTLIRHRPIQGESNIDFLGESEGSLPQPHDSLPDACEAMNDFWSMSGSFIYRHHVEPRVKLYSLREESFPIPLKYIDVTRTTHTNLDVKQEKRIDDYWNIDGSRDLSDPWTGFTQFTLLDEKAPDGCMWSRERLRRKQLTSRPDHLWPELWKSMGKHAKLKEKQKWSEEKLHLENARKLRGIYFIDPEDTEFKEIIKNARKKLETSVAPAMPCKMAKNCGNGASNKIQTKLACILEADESTRMRMGNSIPNHHEGRIAGRRKFITALQFGSQIYSYASSCENSGSESSGGQGMGKIGEIFGVEPDKSQK